MKCSSFGGIPRAQRTDLLVLGTDRGNSGIRWRRLREGRLEEFCYMQCLNSICELRIAVAHLGEKAQFGWWDTSFLSSIGFRYLELIYPRTTASASVTATSEAACREHDERIGKGRVSHLFRLPEDTELKLRAELAGLSLTKLAETCSQDAAFRFLDALAGDAKPAAGAGPVRIGTLKELPAATGLSCMAATYAAGFRSGTRVFPYFA